MVTFHLAYSLIRSDMCFELPSDRGAPKAATKAGRSGLAKQSKAATKAAHSGLTKDTSTSSAR